MSLTEPEKIDNPEYRFDAFSNQKVLLGKKKNHLPAMGWNSWNAFGSGNTENLTKQMADAIINLGLDKLGYKFLVLDDGCYKSKRNDGKLENDEVKFPGGFKSLSEYIHAKGLKFGMYNDIGTNLCAGAAVGTCGHETTDGESYVNWGVDFLKIDNCYFLWDNATFSNPENAQYVYAPNIKSIVLSGPDFSRSFSAVQDGILEGLGAEKKEDYVTNIGTFDGTNTGTTPNGPRSSELIFKVSVPKTNNYNLKINYASSKEPGVGRWLQLKVNDTLCYDNLLPETASKETFIESEAINVSFIAGENIIRLMNHRRQENTLCAYAAMLDGLNKANPDHDILLSICEWGKTQPHNWGYKVGDSWRILNDITFRVGSDGDAGFGEWANPGTQSVTSQYNKAVVMDEYAGLEKGWNDPDMLMIGMKGLSPIMNKTHFTMWCMMNSPLMLGLDLRRVSKGDEIYNIISNKALIDLNQDKLGIQAKRIWTSCQCENPSTEYIQNNQRVDILAKPLSDNSIALSFINLSETTMSGDFSVNVNLISQMLGNKLPEDFTKSKSFKIIDLWTNEESSAHDNTFGITQLAACDNYTIKIIPC